METERIYFNVPHYDYDKELTDYFHIPYYNHSAYSVYNLENSNSYLNILENTFEGTEDSIDFANGYGYTLSVKAELHDAKDKIILAKGDVNTGNFYFVLKEENRSIVFEFYTGSEVITLSHYIEDEELGEYARYPLTFTFMISNETSPTLSLYKNNELLDQKQAGENTALIASDYNLVNILSTSDEDQEEKVVSDIVGMKGMLDEKELYYVNTVLNTNL